MLPSKSAIRKRPKMKHCRGKSRVSSCVNVYQNTGIEKEDDSRKFLENHGKIDEIRRFFYKKIDDGHDVHCLGLGGGLLKPTNAGNISTFLASWEHHTTPF